MRELVPACPPGSVDSTANVKLGAAALRNRKPAKELMQ